MSSTLSGSEPVSKPFDLKSTAMQSLNTSTPAAHAVAQAVYLSRTLGCSEASLAGLLLLGLEQLQAWMAVKDLASGRYLSVHPRLAALWGHSAERVMGAGDVDLFDAQVAATLRSADQSFLAHVADGLPMSTTHRMNQGGVMREFQVTRLAASIQPDEPSGLATPRGALPPTQILSLWVDRSVATQQDARLKQTLQQLEQQQRRLSSLEHATSGVASEVSVVWPASNITPDLFDDQLRREMDLSNREHREFALVLLSIDSPVRGVPDSSSRLAEARRRMVESLAFLLKTNIRSMDFTCRIADGGFAVLLSGVGLATATARMEQIRRQCAAQSVVLDGQDWRFSVSMGVASFPLTAQNEANLRSSAELALAKAQQRGGNQIALASVRFRWQQEAIDESP